MRNRKDLRVHLPDWFTKMFPDAIWKLPTGNKTVYLTFDDGPIPEVTPDVLDILKEYNIKATFFCVGENVFNHPDVFNQIIEDGHAIGNHTHNHIQGFKCSDSFYYDNIDKANKFIGSNLFRPPHGVLKRSQYRYLSKKYRIIMWDVISCDYDPKLTPEHCFCNVVDFVRDGSIITFHDSIKAKKNVLHALPRVIEHLRSEGYEFKKVEFPKTRPLNSAPLRKHLEKIRTNIAKKRKWA